jgi:NAD(P)H-dependent FMN reductase
MSSNPHILVIFGSTRQARQGEVVVNWLKDRLALRTDLTFEIADLRDFSLPFFDNPKAPIWGQIAPEAEAWSALVGRADGFIFITPEYNHSFPAVLKNALDHLYFQWAHKPAAIVNYGGFAAGYRAAESLRQVLIELNTVPIGPQVGISLVPGMIPNVSDAPEGEFLGRAYNAMMTELLWWSNATVSARARNDQHMPG